MFGHDWGCAVYSKPFEQLDTESVRFWRRNRLTFLKYNYSSLICVLITCAVFVFRVIRHAIAIRRIMFVNILLKLSLEFQTAAEVNDNRETVT